MGSVKTLAVIIIPISLFFIIISLILLFEYVKNSRTYKPGTFGFYIDQSHKIKQCVIEAVLDNKYIVMEMDNSINTIDKKAFILRRKLKIYETYDKNGNSVEI